MKSFLYKREKYREVYDKSKEAMMHGIFIKGKVVKYLRSGVRHHILVAAYILLFFLSA